jgi:hypothetical protein
MTTFAVLELDAGFMSGGNYAYVGINLVGDGSVAAPDQITHDITAFGRDAAGWNVARGSTSGVTSGFVAPGGTYNATLDNRDRRFDPNYTSGPYNTQVKRGVPILLFATYNAITYSLFQGFADGWPQTNPNLGRDQTVGLGATDGTARMANANLDITRPVELSGARVQAVLNAIGYLGATSISPGSIFVSALTQQTNTSTVSAWSHLTDVVMAEGGELYFDDDNTLVFRDRNLIQSETRSRTSQATFGDAGAELLYQDVKQGSPPVINAQEITWNATGSKVNAADGTSQRAYWGLQAGPPLVLPYANAVDAAALASWIVQRYAQEINTFVSVTIKPSRDPANLWPQVLGRKLGDQITVNLTPQGPGSRLSKTCLIRGIHHDYQSRDWTTTFYLQDASWLANIAIVGTNLVGDGSVTGF